ncbi:hypothetical protein LTS17_011380 [Exophiala oligosperma]
MSITKDFTYQRSSDGTTCTIVASDLVFTPDLIDPKQDHVIYADSLTFDTSRGDLWFPGHSLTIYARQLFQSSPGSGSISTKGVDCILGAPAGKDKTNDDPKVNGNNPNGQDGDPAKPEDFGGDAGDITIVVGEIPKAMSFNVSGGKGRAGQDGGDAAVGLIGPSGRDDDLSSNHKKRYSEGTIGGVGCEGGKGGDSGIPGRGGSGGMFHCNTLIDVRVSGVLINVGHRGGMPGDPGKGGLKAPGGPGGIGGRRYKWHHYPMAGGEYIDDGRYDNGPQGPPGKDGRQRTGSLGSRGELWFDTINDLTKYFQPDDHLFGYLQLLLQVVKVKYLDGDYSRTKEMLTWIYGITKAPSTTDKWQGLHDESRVLLGRLSRGLDYFGNAVNFVPLASFNLYCSSVTNMLILGSHIEDVFQNFTTFLADQTKTYKDFDAAFKQAQDVINAYTQNRDTTIKQRKALWDECLDLGNQIAQAKQVMMDAEEKFKDAVNRKAKCLAFKDILGLVATIVACPENVASVMDSLEKLSASALASKVISIAGELPTDYLKLCQTIDKISSDFTDSADLFKKVQAHVDDDGAKLVTSVEDFDIKLEEFASMPEAADYKIAVHHYANLCTTRNAKIVECSKMDELILSFEGKILQTKAQLDQLQSDKASLADPTTAPYRNFMLSLYQNFKDNMLNYLFYEINAFKYRTLQDFDKILQSGNTLAEFQVLQSDILAAAIDFENSAGHETPYSDTKLDVTALAAPNWQGTFSTTGVLDFQVPLDIHAFAGWSEVRALTFRASLVGLKSSSSSSAAAAAAASGSGGGQEDIYITLTCHGDSTIVARDGKKHRFTHNAVQSVYQYKLGSDGREQYEAGGTLADSVGTGAETKTIALSPFCTWSLRVPRQDKSGNPLNVGVDLTTVTQVLLFFSGTAVGSAAGGGGSSSSRQGNETSKWAECKRISRRQW